MAEISSMNLAASARYKIGNRFQPLTDDNLAAILARDSAILPIEFWP
jgi:hypothetical protein